MTKYDSRMKGYHNLHSFPLLIAVSIFLSSLRMRISFLCTSFFNLINSCHTSRLLLFTLLTSLTASTTASHFSFFFSRIVWWPRYANKGYREALMCFIMALHSLSLKARHIFLAATGMQSA
ncbi:hypothetical protein E2C01_027675 [Portunus trituberculatus]|uniref:Uncharacterized protein n=1 Tax=Portunus trituberculatus TaxID=210409 RepID=A0A5B7EJC0_PORTR|nr:hypothetical protein [Portunus trituberculatus]